jgi:hypothetical protein
MKTKIDWSTYKFRASQTHKLLTGSLPDKREFDKRILELENERDFLVNANGNKVKWTINKQDELDNLLQKKNTPYHELLPKTMTSELRKIHRSETFGRNFSFTNKYVQKGIAQEEQSISVFQTYRREFNKINFPLENNKKILSNDYVSGEADLTDTNNFENCNEGFDTKCSWELETFPFKGDSLDTAYECQNQVYMWLSGAKKWTTVYVLVNVTEDLLHKEKMKWFYALGQPMDIDDKNYEEYQKQERELEIRLIFNYDEFVKSNSGHQMAVSKLEWIEKELNIPLIDRVVEKESFYSESFIYNLTERIKVSREYLESL